jgi:hypothetical protein
MAGSECSPGSVKTAFEPYLNELPEPGFVLGFVTYRNFVPK